MAPESDDRAALFERIIALGNRRRRRRVATVGSLSALIVIAAGALVMADRDGNERTRTADDVITSTTLPLVSTSTTDTAPDLTTTSVVDTTTTSVVEETTTTTSSTEPPPVCRNSYDSRCGPFYWDYDPATWPNAPATITATHQPATIVAGEPVTFVVTFHDPDHAWSDNCAGGSMAGATPSDEYSYLSPDGSLHFPCAVPGCGAREPDPAGPWDPPPPPPPPEPRTHQITVTFDQSGSYSVSVQSRPSEFCNGFPGYLSPLTVTVPIEVRAA